MALNYSNLNNSDTYKRNQVKNLLDSFATFMWRGKNSFDEYGMFIINEKGGSLKFYNGSDFKNEYTQPQYQTNSGNLTGISFSPQTISFKVGIYWFSIEDYRKILNWLSPYEVSYLSFDFSYQYDKKYGYLCKLNKRTDSTRYILGYGEDNKPRYYTELTLNWEIQGPSCARAVEPMSFNVNRINTWDENGQSQLTGYTVAYSMNIDKSINQNIGSDIDTSMLLDTTLYLEDISSGDLSEDTYIDVTLYCFEKVENSLLDNIVIDSLIQNSDKVFKTDLFSIRLTNLTYYPNRQSNNFYNLNISYDSETSLLYYRFGDSNRKLVTLLSSVTEGENLTDSFVSYKYSIEGALTASMPTNDWRDKWVFVLKLSSNTLTSAKLAEIMRDNSGDANDDVPSIVPTVYARTNVI